MNDKYIKGYLASSIIAIYYQKLEVLMATNMEGTKEYLSIINKLKELVSIELDYYYDLTIEELVKYYSLLDYSLAEFDMNYKRYYDKITEMYNTVRDDEPITKDGHLLIDVINSKITIDTYKLMDNGFSSISQDEIDNNNKLKDIIMYYKASIITNLNSNSYIEQIALECYYNINLLPNINLGIDDKKFNHEFQNISMDLYLNNIFDSIEYLLLPKDNTPLSSFITLSELYRIKAILSYLNKRYLSKLDKQYNNKYHNINNPLLNKVKSLIKEKEEEK